jgi:hypothetical protein
MTSGEAFLLTSSQEICLSSTVWKIKTCRTLVFTCEQFGQLRYLHTLRWIDLRSHKTFPQV